MNALDALRAASAMCFGVVGWGIALSWLQTWFGFDPNALLSRIPAFLLGCGFSIRVLRTSHREVVDIPSAVFFPAKYAGVLALVLCTSWSVTRLVSKIVSTTLLGDGAGLAPPIELLVWVASALLMLSHFEHVVFDADLRGFVTWFSRSPTAQTAQPGPAGTTAAPSASHVRSEFGAQAVMTELFEMVTGWWRDRRRRVRRRHDESPVHSESAARRRAERAL